MAKKKQETALVLRVCSPELKSHGGFQWPNKVGAVVEAPDWEASDSCGNGLHGWLYGAGDGSVADYIGSPDAKWLVVEIVLSESIALGGKVKFPRCTIKHIGDKLSATTYLLANEKNSAGLAVIGATATAGYSGTATAGDYGTATAGDRGTATAGDYGTATAGDRGTATAGDYGTATAGDRGTATAGDSGTATAGDYGTATAGYSGTATAGYSGTATAGDRGTATAGYRGTATAGYSGTATAGHRGTATAGDSGTATAGDSGTATAGYSGTATAGDSGEIRIRYWDEKAERYRTAIGYIGENGIKPNTKYRLNDKNRFEEVV